MSVFRFEWEDAFNVEISKKAFISLISVIMHAHFALHRPVYIRNFRSRVV